MLNLTKALELIESCNIYGDSNLIELKELIIDEIKLQNASSKGSNEKSRYRVANKFIEDFIKNNPKIKSLHGCSYSKDKDKEYQYLCDGFILVKLKNQIENLKENENESINHEGVLSNFNSMHCQDSDIKEIENNLSLALLKTQLTQSKAFAKAEIKRLNIKYYTVEEYLSANYIETNVCIKIKLDNNINKYLDVRKIITVLEMLKNYNQQEYKVYSDNSKLSPLYISNGIDTAMILPVKIAERLENEI